VILDGRSISKGRAEGKVLKLNGPLSFLGGVDASTGQVKVENGGNVSGRILVFPKGKGSTVGSFVMYDLKTHGKSPAAVINSSAETIVATGAVISSIPMVDRIDVGLIRDGDEAVVDADEGTVELKGVSMVESVSSVVLIGGKVMLLERPKTARSFPGKWSLCSGKIEKGESPEQAAAREIGEEVSIGVNGPEGKLEPIFVREGATIWKVHPFLFRADGQTPKLNHENVQYRLVDPSEIQSFETVDGLGDIVKRLL
jgi:uncharacterized protein